MFPAGLRGSQARLQRRPLGTWTGDAGNRMGTSAIERGDGQGHFRRARRSRRRFARARSAGVVANRYSSQ